MIVLDASATLELLLGSPSGRRLAERLAHPELTVHAPHLMSVEVAQVIRRLAASGQINLTRASGAITDLADLDVVRYEHDSFLPRMWELRDNLTAYDAAYIALAETLDAPLVTRDRHLARSPGHRARVEVLAD